MVGTQRSRNQPKAPGESLRESSLEEAMPALTLGRARGWSGRGEAVALPVSQQRLIEALHCSVVDGQRSSYFTDVGGTEALNMDRMTVLKGVALKAVTRTRVVVGS